MIGTVTNKLCFRYDNRSLQPIRQFQTETYSTLPMQSIASLVLQNKFIATVCGSLFLNERV